MTESKKKTVNDQRAWVYAREQCAHMNHMRGLMLAAALVFTGTAQAQVTEEHATHDPEENTPRARVGAGAIFLGTVAQPGIGNRTLAEGYITQPMVMGRFEPVRDRLSLSATLNFEGETLQRGELNAGVYGEGYVDRRHPHTFVHELIATASGARAGLNGSLTAGKGFIPFGTDDPMSRPFVKYPVNHHLAQLLERVGVIGAVLGGPIGLEVALFNGDEPESPSDKPDLGRVGDSWSTRLTARPRPSVELQFSTALVESPEISRGGGLDHRKHSASARFENSRFYALTEWARTSEAGEGDVSFTFTSILAEGSVRVGRVSFSVRGEQTGRPEEERLENLFRTPRPHSDLSIQGSTQWDVVSAAVAGSLRRAPGVQGFIELSTQHPTPLIRPTLFEPEDFYGSSRLWSFSAGVRLRAGMRHGRMGRYGAAADRSTH